MGTAVATPRPPARSRRSGVAHALVVATLLAAVVADLAVTATAWHLTCLGALVGVVALGPRLPRPPRRPLWHVRRDRAADLSTGAVVAAQPALHVLVELWHRSTADPEPGAVHLGLLGLHLALAGVVVAVLAVADVVVPAVAEACRRCIRLLAAVGATPEDRVRRLGTVVSEVVTDGVVWVAYAVRRGPPGRPSVA